MSLDELTIKVRDIQTRIEAAQRARVKSEQDKDRASASVDQIRRTLDSEFGVTTIEDARAVLTKLEDELSEEIKAVQAALDEIGV